MGSLQCVPALVKTQDLQGNKDEDGESNEMQRLLDMCKITGATFSYGDAFNDYESDPTWDIQSIPPRLWACLYLAWAVFSVCQP